MATDEQIERTQEVKKSELDLLPFVLVVLTFITGLVDAVSFLGLGHVFTANMTGNVVFLAFALAGAPGLSLSRSVTSLLAFMFGATVGGFFGNRFETATRRKWLLTSAIVEVVLLLAAAGFAFSYDYKHESPDFNLYAILILTAVAMGFRNATVRRLAVPDLTTTVLTLTVTGIAADSSFAGGANTRFVRRGLSVVGMFAGALTGALLLDRGLQIPLFLGAFLVLAATIVYAAHPSSNRPAKEAKK